MKMTMEDRLEAIKRCPQYLEYQKAFLEASKESDPKKRCAILKKIRFPWRDPLEFHYLCLPDEPGFDGHRKGLLKHFDRESVVLVKEGEGPWGKNRPEPNSIWTYNKSRVFMRLSIDLNKSDEELKKSFMEIVNCAKEDMYRHGLMKPGVPKGRTTRKKREYDPWEIYDLCKKGLSKNEIARMKSGLGGNPIDNPDLSTPDKRVDRAYNQAKK